MNRICKELRKLFALLPLITSSVCADEAEANNAFPQESYSYEQKSETSTLNDDLAQESSECGWWRQNTGTFVANDYFPQENCCEQNLDKFFLRGDILYWRPYLSGLELGFGTGSIDLTTSGCSKLINSKEFDIDPNFEWDAGYRVAGGYAIDNCWGIGADWTHFCGKGHRRSFYNGDITSHGKFHVEFDQLDLVLAYEFAFNCNFKIKPFIGARGARIKDYVKGLITTQLTINQVVETGEIRHFNHRQDYRAAGLLLGLQADYDLGHGFGVYGTAAGSLLYGRYRVKFDDATFVGALAESQIFTKNRRHLYSFDPNIDLALGVSWKTDLFECGQLSMKLGFEHHEYFNQNRLSVSRGDMSFSGGIFSIEFAL